MTRIPLKIAGGLQLGVAVYVLTRAATKASYVKVDSRTNEEVKTVTKYICEVRSIVKLIFFKCRIYQHLQKNPTLQSIVESAYVTPQICGVQPLYVFYAGVFLPAQRTVGVKLV